MRCTLVVSPQGGAAPPLLRPQKPGGHLGPSGELFVCVLLGPGEQFGIEPVGILEAQVAFLHQGLQLADRREDRGCVGRLPVQGQHHAAAGPVFPSPSELAPANGVSVGGADFPNAPALAVLLPDGEPEGLVPLLPGCHAPNVRQTRLWGLRSQLGGGPGVFPVLRQIVRQTGVFGCPRVLLTPCLGCARH